MQFKILVNNIEQLDLALEHLSKGDVNNARFALMLIDNVIEITLHHVALEKQAEQKWLSREKVYEHSNALNAALGQRFERKISFARIIEIVTAEESETINILHGFRNEVYHIGLQHETILLEISKFYLKLAGDILARYFPSSLSYSSTYCPPERALKYFNIKNREFFSPRNNEYSAACLKLSQEVKFDPVIFTETLSNHMDEIIDQSDTSIDMMANGGPQKYSRDEAIIEGMAWKIAFSEEGKLFAEEHAWPGGNTFDLIKWIGMFYPFELKSDPIQGWKKRADATRREKNPHKALKKYNDFMSQTSESRAFLEEQCAAIDRYIDGQIDLMRGK